MAEHTVVVVGGTQGLGRDLARHYAEAGRRVVVTGRDTERAAAAAAELGASVEGLAFDLSEPMTIAPALAGLGSVDRLALAALDRDLNTVKDYDIEAAIRLVTLKLVGYTEVVHALLDRLTPDASVLLYGGLAKLRPYPGSTTITTINHGVDGLVGTMAAELPPIRVNALHPGIVGDSPFWAPKTEALEATKAKTPTAGSSRCATSPMRRCSCWRTRRCTGPSSGSTGAGRSHDVPRRRARRRQHGRSDGGNAPPCRVRRHRVEPYPRAGRGRSPSRTARRRRRAPPRPSGRRTSC